MIPADTRPAELATRLLHANVLAAFGDDTELAPAELLARLADADTYYQRWGVLKLTAMLARIGIGTHKVRADTGGRSVYRLSDFAADTGTTTAPADAPPAPALDQVAALIAAARVDAEQARAYAYEEYVLHCHWQAEDAEQHAAKHWAKEFAVGEQAPPVLAWQGWPLPATRVEQARTERDEHPDTPIAIAHLGGGVFLRHKHVERRVWLGDHHGTDREDSMFVIAPCVCGNVRDSKVHDVLGLGEVLEQVTGKADAWHGDCEPSRTVPRTGDEDEESVGIHSPGTAPVLQDILAERVAQLTKWGVQHHPDGTGGPVFAAESNEMRARCQYLADHGGTHWRAILLEEIYEAFAEDNPDLLRAELVQVAAVAVAWIEDIDTRDDGES